MSDAMKDRVVVFPFARQEDGAEIVIGRSDGANFLALPPDAVEILDDLASGSSLGEAQSHYLERYGELPDVEDLVEALEAEGFVQRERRGRAAPGRPESPATLSPGDPVGLAADGFDEAKEGRVVKPIGKRFHFSGFPRPLAQAIFSTPVFAAGGLLVALAAAAIFADPSIVPAPSALYFSEHLGVSVVWLALLVTLQICVHELAHLVGARARGVPVRFGFGHRLWLLVLETDMSGVWTLPRRKRYLPILVGPFVDLISLALLILALAGEQRGLFELSPVSVGVLRAMVIVYLYQLIWQCFFFVRTDFYYVVSNFFGCKNLMQDTQSLLRNLWAQWRGRGKVRDLSGIPEPEMRVIRGYSAVWLLGRVLALYLLIFIQFPIVFQYFTLMGRTVANFFTGRPLASAGVLVPSAIAFTTFVIGMILWIRSLRASSNSPRLEPGSPGSVTSHQQD